MSEPVKTTPPSLTAHPAWKALQRHLQQVRTLHLRDTFSPLSLKKFNVMEIEELKNNNEIKKKFFCEGSLKFLVGVLMIQTPLFPLSAK